MLFKTTVNWLLNDIWCYLIIACFDWKIGVFQETVVRVCYNLNADRKGDFYFSWNQLTQFRCKIDIVSRPIFTEVFYFLKAFQNFVKGLLPITGLKLAQSTRKMTELQ